MSHAQVTSKSRVPTGAKPTARLHNYRSQSKSGMQKVVVESVLHPADAADPERAEYTSDSVVAHRRTGNKTDYKVRWYEISRDEET